MVQVLQIIFNYEHCWGSTGCIYRVKSFNHLERTCLFGSTHSLVFIWLDKKRINCLLNKKTPSLNSAALLWPPLNRLYFFLALVLTICSLVDMLLLQHHNIWFETSGAVHTQHGGDWDAQRSLRVPRGKPHRTAGGAPASSREANQPGHQVRKCKHKTCTHTHGRAHRCVSLHR